ncbi:hypothetical protein PtB15_3B615 [Puccinia triticina]|nr:hypothetical protein PtB15_3B615 [Puccinia triticina]
MTRRKNCLDVVLWTRCRLPDRFIIHGQGSSNNLACHRLSPEYRIPPISSGSTYTGFTITSSIVSEIPQIDRYLSCSGYAIDRKPQPHSDPE